MNSAKRIITVIALTLIGFTAALKAGEADTVLLKQHLTRIIKTAGHRNYTRTDVLDSVAAYIKRELGHYADTVYYQEYQVTGKTYKNVIAGFSVKKEKTIVVGAHYDVCEEQDGADDNASGVAGLLELARLLKGQSLTHRIELVAYSLEEPPFFRTEYMGSYVHAKSLSVAKRNVYGMISLEMIGYFKDERKSQTYPLGLLKWFYGSRGNYITLVKKYGAGRFVKRFSKGFIRSRQIRTKKFAGSTFLPGIDFSDHLNYWKFDYSALMITDTSFYRNKNYHQPTDTIETLDLSRMAKVIDACRLALLALK